jgi:hypothetical protein
MSFAGFSNVPRYSRLRALRLDGASPRPSYPQRPLGKKRRPRYTLSPERRRNTIRPHQYATDSATKLTRALSPTRAGAVRGMALRAAIIHDEADTTTARKTEAPHPSLRVCVSSARPSGELDS